MTDRGIPGLPPVWRRHPWARRACVLVSASMRRGAARAAALVARYPELAVVVLAVVAAVAARRPLQWLDARHAVSVALAALVFSTAVTIEPAALRRAAAGWRALAAALAAGVTALPALAWLAARIAPAGPLRDGVLAAGLAPSEIASVATTAMAGGEAALAAGVLIGSTLATVLAAGPALALESGRPGHSAAGITASLALIVALPLAAGIMARAWAPRAASAAGPARVTSAVTVAVLVALVSAQVSLSAGYLRVTIALAAFLAASAALGRLLCLLPAIRPARPAKTAVLLTVSMRDFAIAAGLAAAASGAAAAGPLGVYGILVLAWGTAAAGYLRSRD
jgi:predicted Na+-dependent transporter